MPRIIRFLLTQQFSSLSSEIPQTTDIICFVFGKVRTLAQYDLKVCKFTL